jgi:hypothetical protein
VPPGIDRVALVELAPIDAKTFDRLLGHRVLKASWCRMLDHARSECARWAGFFSA